MIRALREFLLPAALLVAAGTVSADFNAADSLAAAGLTDAASSHLLQLLRNGSEPADLILFRLVGVYHGAGREEECLLLLDSLEEASGTELTGWKVSVLDLARETDRALGLATDDPLLTAWLVRAGGLESRGVSLPAPDGLAGRAIRAMSCPDGTMSMAQIDQTVSDAVMLPFLAEEVCDELERSLETAGPWWDEMASDLSAACACSRLNRLSVERQAHLLTGSEDHWESLLDEGGDGSLIAAEMLTRLQPSVWNRSWRVADALAENGDKGGAEALAALSTDADFILGVRMAVLRCTGHHAELLSLCDSVPADSPDSLLARAALYRARALRALERPASEYHPAYLAFATSYPWHPTASEAACLAARYFEGERNWAAAADAYMTALASGGYGDSQTYWRGGFCHYMCGRGATGDSIWTAGIERFPFSFWCDEMLFWRARYANRTGDGDAERVLLAETAARHPWEFYGVLATLRAGRELRISPSVPETDLRADPLLSEAVSMVAGGYGTMASTMLFTSGSSDPGTRASGLALMGEWGRCIGLLRSYDTSLRNEGLGILPDSLLRFFFPSPFSGEIRAATSNLGVSPWLVSGLMRQESGFDRWAGSSVGARGLIQLMPGTAGDIARWYQLDPMTGEDFYLPERSIAFGSLYLDRQYDSFDSVLPAVLAAYNAGPGNASRWMEEFPCESDDPELFIEQITFSETRGYVKHVMTNAMIYEAMER